MDFAAIGSGLTRRDALKLALVATLPWTAWSCSTAHDGDAPLLVGGLPVTCNLTHRPDAAADLADRLDPDRDPVVW